ncbi:MAG: adenine phosphoribosyltransferase [Anaerolineae bacterium]|nr:adenine phosphoribosyltransferase [Anaerolineae bacterium]
MSAQGREVYPVEVAGLKRDLPLFEVAPGVRIAILNILGDVEFVQAVAAALASKITTSKPDVLVTAEAKSIPLVYALAVETGLPYVVLRKNYKPYMGEALEAHTVSITTGTRQTLYLDEKDHVLLRGKRAALIDDVISTGSTLQGMHLLMDKVGAAVVVQAAVFTEGDRAKWTDIVALGHLPVFIDESAGMPD